MISALTEIIIVEGNYLLLDRQQWKKSACNYDLTVSLQVPRSVLKERLIRRWTDKGFDAEVAIARACGNDLSNADIVIGETAKADVQIAMGDFGGSL